MKLILCVDERMGMAFCGRRQSRDRAVVERIASRTAGQRLWMTEYSAALFPETEYICVSAHPMRDAGENDWCLEERENPEAFAECIEQVVVYRWNRHYPSDVRCTLPLEQWRRISMDEFAGYSHEKITEEVYQR